MPGSNFDSLFYPRSEQSQRCGLGAEDVYGITEKCYFNGEMIPAQSFSAGDAVFHPSQYRKGPIHRWRGHNLAICTAQGRWTIRTELFIGVHDVVVSSTRRHAKLEVVTRHF